MVGQFVQLHDCHNGVRNVGAEKYVDLNVVHGFVSEADATSALQPIVRDIFPLHPTHPLHPDHTAASLINAYKASPSHQHSRLLHADQGAKYHTRWERLCLIELAGIAAVQAQQREGDEVTRQACADCGKIHVELFLVDSGSYERHIREMVLRWQRFVESVLQ